MLMGFEVRASMWGTPLEEKGISVTHSFSLGFYSPKGSPFAHGAQVPLAKQESPLR